MANTKKTSTKVENSDEKESASLETSVEASDLPVMNPMVKLEDLNTDLWVPINDDNNTRVMFVKSGSVVLVYTPHGVSSCYVPNVIYTNGKFERI